MACQEGCGCCKGACCYESGGVIVCTQETCEDCEELEGEFQGVGTECVSGDCPCDPPADHRACEKCEDNSAVGRCEEGENCCDGICQVEECETECTSRADCPNYGLTCAEIVPDVPYDCCDGVCTPQWCYPGVRATVTFTKKVGCTAAFLSGIPEGGEFVVVGDFSPQVDECLVAPYTLGFGACLVEWEVDTGCDVLGLTYIGTGTGGPGSQDVCDSCYEFSGYTTCLVDCDGNCQ